MGEWNPVPMDGRASRYVKRRANARDVASVDGGYKYSD
jgi:hypothetical protein